MERERVEMNGKVRELEGGGVKMEKEGTVMERKGLLWSYGMGRNGREENER